MVRTRLTHVPCLVLSSLLAALIAASPVQAVTYILYAAVTDAGRNNGMDNFSVMYDDIDNNGRLSSSEQIWFSGLTTHNFDNPPVSTHFNILLWAAGSEDTPYTSEIDICDDSPNTRSWEFGKWNGQCYELQLSAPAYLWEYSQVAVPLPSSALLLATGLIPLAFARRRQRREK